MAPPKKKKLVNKNDYAAKIRTAEQCFLVGNVQYLASRAVDGTYSPSTQNNTTFKNSILKHSLCRHHISLPYNADHSEILGKYFIGKEIATLFDLKTHELSAIVPKINLYRVQMDSATGKAVNTLEFYFPSHVSKENVKRAITGQSDRFGEAGILGVNWQLLGGQPAEVKRYVQVDLEFFFSSISTLTRERNIKEDPHRLSYLDLFRRRGPLEGYRLRMDVGWHLPEKNIHLFKTMERAEQVRKALHKSTQTMWLNLRNHDLKFNQNGTVNLTINYISSLEYDLAKISIVKDTRTKVSKKKKEANIKKAEKLYSRMIKDECTPALNSWWKSTDFKAHAASKKLMKERIEFMKKMKTQGGLGVLKEIDRQLHKKIKVKGPKGGEVTRSRVFAITADVAELGFTSGELILEDMPWYNIFVLGKNDTTAQNIQAAGIEAYGSVREKALKHLMTRKPEPQFKSGVSSMLVGAIKKQKNAKDAKAYKEQIKKLTASLITNATTAGGHKTTSVKYCFLGDLIDAAIDACVSLYGTKRGGRTIDSSLNSILSNMKIVYGSVVIPTFPIGGGPPSKHKICMADLPVSYNLFNAWFIKHVIDSGRTSFLLKDFIRLLLTQLVNVALGNNCYISGDFFKKFPRNKIDISFHTARIPRNGNKSEEAFTKSSAEESLTKVPFWKKRLTSGQIQNLKFEEADPDKANVKMVNYLFITTNSQAMNVRVKDRVKDMETGVFHVNIAQDSGIVRNITFNKAQADYLEESLLADQKRKRELDVFRRVYNADLECYGNASFIPGQLIYVDPTVVGMDDPASEISTARQLGLGGYHVVTKVSNSIKSGDFSTTVNTRWVGFGDGKTLFPTAAQKAAKAKKAKIEKCKNKETSWKELVEKFKALEGFDIS